MSTASMNRSRSGRMASRHRREKTADILCLVLLVVLGLAVMFPIYWIFRSSLSSSLVRRRTLRRIMRLWRMTSTEILVPR